VVTKDDHGMTVALKAKVKAGTEIDAVAGTASARTRWGRARFSAATVIRKGTQ
jgi:hypothetical protein